MTERSLQIAFIGGRGVGGVYSGIETYYEEVGSRLAARGHTVTAYCRPHFTPDVPSFRGIRIRRLPCVRSKHLETISHSFLSTLDALRQPFDVVHYHAIGSAVLSLLPRLARQVTLLSVHGLDWQRAKWGGVARNFLKVGEWASAHCPTGTVVVSRTLQRHYAALYRREPYCIPNAIAPCIPRPIERIARYGLERDGFILFAGRLSPEKGVDVLLEAMRPLQGRLKLVLAGGSSYSDGYIDVLRRAAGKEVLFLGNVDRSTMDELYSNCYAFVLPSVMEGLSIALLEALGFGACILATNIPENLEVVGSAALSFAPGDVAGLSALLQHISEHPETVHAYRQRALAQAAAQPDWDDVTSLTERFYYDLVERRSRSAPPEPARA